MTFYTFILWSVCVMALLSSIGALLVAIRSWRQCRASSLSKLYDRLTVQELTTEELSSQLRNIRAARNMAAGRARKAMMEAEASADPPSTDPEAEKARQRAELNRMIAAGKSPNRGIP